MAATDDLDFKPSVLLRDGIDIENVSRGMVTFETDTEFLHQLDMAEGYQSDSEEPNFFGYNEMESWVQKPFAKLWSEMTPVGNDDLIRKSIIVHSEGNPLSDNSSIKVRLSGFCEGALEPFTCTVDCKTMILHIGDGGQLPGLDMSLKTMRVGEYSRFLISYKLMYGVLGCPKLIPAKADCLFNILVVGLVPAIEDRSDLRNEYSTFTVIYEKAVALHITGKMFFQKEEYRYAIRSFRSAVHYLEFCRLKDEIEEAKQQKFLGKLYLNLAICYNKLKLPLKACCMCNTLNYMGKLQNNSKALFHNGRALLMIGDYKAAEKKLRAAQKLDRNCPNIRKEIELLQEKRDVYQKRVETLTQPLNHSFRVYRDKKLVSDEPSEDFSSSVRDLCKSLLNDTEIVTANLPNGLTKAESDEVKRIVDDHKLFCDESDIVTFVSKIKISDIEE